MMYTKRRRRKVKSYESGDYRVEDNETVGVVNYLAALEVVYVASLVQTLVGFVFLIAAGGPDYKMLSSPSLWAFASAAALIKTSLGQFPPAPKGVTVLNSKFDENITISYKEVCPQACVQR